MNKIKFLIIISVVLLISAACDDFIKKQNQEEQQDFHEVHRGLKNDFKHSDIILLDKQYSVGDSVKKQFNQVIEGYLSLSEALVIENDSMVDNEAAKIAEIIKDIAINSVDNLDKQGTKAWNQHIKLYKTKLAEMIHIKGTENKRSYFSHISEVLYCTLKSFDVTDKKLYAAYCPMAFGGKGAYWITNTREIRNPYFGNKMLNCGEIKEEIE